jgi:hypothetical protein
MKRKDYKEVSPEPKDYGGSDYSDDRSPSSWAAAGREDNDLYYWEEVPKEKTPEGPNGSGNDDGGNDDDEGDDDDDDSGDDVGDPGDDDPFGCIQCVVRLAVTPSRSSRHRSTNVSRPWRR